MFRPRLREPLFDISVAPLLADAWKYSVDRVQEIESTIGDCLPRCVACAAVSGSLARMEAHSSSDIDLVIVIDDRRNRISDDEASEIFDSAWKRLDVPGAVRPKAGGIFSQCARWTELVNPAAKGCIDESINTFGHRIQLLMDAQPITSADRFSDLQKEILHWYSETHLTSMFDESGPFHWLWQDVQRYWRSLRSRTYWLNADDRSRSVTLNVKLRSSRLMLVFAFLLTLQEQQTTKRSLTVTIDDLERSLRLTPAERLFGTADAGGLKAWETVWHFLVDAAREPTSDLPEAVARSLSVLAQSIEQQMTVTGNAKQNRHWWM